MLDLEIAAELLIQKGADTTVKTKQGNSILMLAASAGNSEALLLIFPLKFEVN